MRTLERLEHQLPAPGAQLAIPFVFRGRGHFRRIRPIQTVAEIEQLYRIVREQRPERVLEIGTASGGTLYLWTKAAAPHATIVSVDLPGGPFGGGYSDHCAPLFQRFGAVGQTLSLVRADSHSARTLTDVRALFHGRGVDFLFIDGDHSYEGVKTDFLQYGPLVRPGGLIAFHDIRPSADPNTRVSRFWEELRARYDAGQDITEIVHPDPAHGNRELGIGVLRVPADGLGRAGIAPLAGNALAGAVG